MFYVQFFYVFLPPLPNIFCFCYVHTISVFIEPIFAWNVLLVSLIFLKRSLVFLILLFSSISLHWSLRKAFLSFLAILWNSAFRWVYLPFSPLPLVSCLFSAVCEASSDSHFAFFAFEIVLLNLKWLTQIYGHLHLFWTFSDSSLVKNLPANSGSTGDKVWFPCQEGPLEENIATDSSILT